MNDFRVKQFENPINGGDADNAVEQNTQVLRRQVDEAISTAPVFDLHTHLFAPQFGDMSLWGIDDLLNYHYLTAELFRFSSTSPDEFWLMEKQARSDLIWRKLFVENTPLSEATRGVISVLSTLGLDTQAPNLKEARDFFSSQTLDSYLEKALETSGVTDIVMTNDPLDETEIQVWNSDKKIDGRFHSSLRLDRILNGWEEAVPLLAKQGYEVSQNVDERSIRETRRFLDDWIAKMKPLYMGVSLPDDFVFPENSPRGSLIENVVLPTCHEHDLSLALMIGVRRRVNPALKVAGDGLGRADVSVLDRICARYPGVRF